MKQTWDMNPLFLPHMPYSSCVILFLWLIKIKIETRKCVKSKTKITLYSFNIFLLVKIILKSMGNIGSEKLTSGISFGTEYGWVTLQGAIKSVVVVKAIRTSNSRIFSDLLTFTRFSIASWEFPKTVFGSYRFCFISTWDPNSLEFLLGG